MSIDLLFSAWTSTFQSLNVKTLRILNGILQGATFLPLQHPQKTHTSICVVQLQISHASLCRHLLPQVSHYCIIRWSIASSILKDHWSEKNSVGGRVIYLSRSVCSCSENTCPIIDSPNGFGGAGWQLWKLWKWTDHTYLKGLWPAFTVITHPTCSRAIGKTCNSSLYNRLYSNLIRSLSLLTLLSVIIFSLCLSHLNR